MDKFACAKSAEELKTLVSENGFELTEEEAQRAFEKIRKMEGELSDEELEKIAGGITWHTLHETYYSADAVKFKFQVGQHVEVITSVGYLSGHVYTKGATVVDRMVQRDINRDFEAYIGYYLLSCPGSVFNGKYVAEYDIEGGYKGIWPDFLF